MAQLIDPADFRPAAALGRGGAVRLVRPQDRHAQLAEDAVQFIRRGRLCSCSRTHLRQERLGHWAADDGAVAAGRQRHHRGHRQRGGAAHKNLDFQRFAPTNRGRVMDADAAMNLVMQTDLPIGNVRVPAQLHAVHPEV